MKWVFRNEADFQSWFSRWLRSVEGFRYVRERGGAVAYELKLAKRRGDLAREARLPFSAVAEHQVVSLMRAAGWRGFEVMNHKISDSAVGFKPFDGVAMCGGAGELVICFEGEGVFSVPVIEWWGEVTAQGRGSVGAGWCSEKGARIGETGEK